MARVEPEADFIEVTQGTAVELTAEFRTGAADGPLTDPATVTLKVRSPDGTVTIAAGVTHPSIGVYVYKTTPTTPGRWWYTFLGVGPAGFEVAVEHQVIVTKRVVQ